MGSCNHGLWYDQKRNGDLAEYLKEHNGSRASNLFRGFRQYRMLWQKGYLEPGISVIRIMYHTGRGDEHYLVVGENELQGIDVPYHPGKLGIHNPRKLLSGECPAWEAQSLNPHPIPRTKKK